MFILVTVLLISVGQNITYAQGSAKIYWEEDDTIRRANLDGSNVEDVLTELRWVTDIALDLHNRKIYWTEFAFAPDLAKIYRANLDGSNIEDILDGEDGSKPYSIALNTDAKKIYWGNNPPWLIRRADFDGSNIEDLLFQGLLRRSVEAESIEIDVKGGKMYWVDSSQRNIARANLDGSKYETLGIGIVDPSGFALDLHNEKIYWTHKIFGEIKRASLNGDNIETLLTELSIPTDIALDVRSNKMYWVEIRGKRIRRANLDGSNVTDILTGLEDVRGGIALDTEGLYDVTPDTSKLTITWANLKVQ